MDKLFKILGDENRLRIINLLMDHELCVCELEIILQTTQSNVSRHLARLRTEGIITYDKRAQWIFYSISRGFVEKHTSLYQYLKDRMSQDQIYLTDSERLKAYKLSGESCETLNGKESVL